MRVSTKLALLVAMASLAMAAMTASPAAAQLEFLSEPGNELCDEVAIEAHDVTGGCHLEFGEGSIVMTAYSPFPVTFSGCEAPMEIRLDGSGSGYVAETTFEDFGPPDCTMVPCDEPASGFILIPWEVTASEAEAQVLLDVSFCFRWWSHSEGSTFARCQTTLQLTQTGSHEYELGDNLEQPCTDAFGMPFSFPITVRPHFTDTNEEEDVEVIH